MVEGKTFGMSTRTEQQRLWFRTIPGIWQTASTISTRSVGSEEIQCKENAGLLDRHRSNCCPWRSILLLLDNMVSCLPVWQRLSQWMSSHFCIMKTLSISASSVAWSLSGDPYTTWLNSATVWVPLYLNYVQDTWPSGGIAVSEFGWSELPIRRIEDDQAGYSVRSWADDVLSQLHDTKGILMATSEDVNVVGCLAWSIMDRWVSI
jgi:hypothetical protein